MMGSIFAPYGLQTEPDASKFAFSVPLFISNALILCALYFTAGFTCGFDNPFQFFPGFHRKAGAKIGPSFLPDKFPKFLPDWQEMAAQPRISSPWRQSRIIFLCAVVIFLWSDFGVLIYIG